MIAGVIGRVLNAHRLMSRVHIRVTTHVSGVRRAPIISCMSMSIVFD